MNNEKDINIDLISNPKYTNSASRTVRPTATRATSSSDDDPVISKSVRSDSNRSIEGRPSASRPVRSENTRRSDDSRSLEGRPSASRPVRSDSTRRSDDSRTSEGRSTASRPVRSDSTRRSDDSRTSEGRPSASRPVRSDSTRRSDDSRLSEGRSTASRPIRSDSTRRSDDSRLSEGRPSALRPVRSDSTRRSDDNRFSEGRFTASRPVRSEESDEYNHSSNNFANKTIKKLKRMSGFKKFIIIYSAALLVILIVGMIIFNSFIKNYETNQPVNLISQITAALSKDASAYLNANKDSINCLENVEDIIAKTSETMTGNQVSFIENSSYRAEAPSYDLTIDGKVIAKVTFEKDSAGAFGLSSWKVKVLDVAQYLPDTLNYSILAPEGAKITVNNKPIDDSYKIKDAAVPEHLAIASKYVNIPSYVTYKISGFTSFPTLTATDANGTALEVSSSSDTFVVGTQTTQEFINSVSLTVEDALENWARHFIHMGDDLWAYMLEGSEWYSYIYGGPDMDPILTSLYEFESISNFEFTEKSATNYIRYTTDCFSVDVKYKMKIDFNNGYMSDENQQLDATWIFITQDGGANWYLIDCIYKS